MNNWSSYHFEFIIIPDHKHDIKYKNGRATFFQIEYLNTQANLCEKYFYPASTKIFNGDVAMR